MARSRRSGKVASVKDTLMAFMQLNSYVEECVCFMFVRFFRICMGLIWIQMCGMSQNLSDLNVS
jgi:hypothetical protein